MSTLDGTTLYNLLRGYSNAVYSNQQDPLSVPRIQQACVAAALQGQFSVVFEYPKTVSQALVIEQQGNTPDFDASVLSYYKTATQIVVDSFKGSPFTLSGLPNAGGFKVSWSGATTTDAPAVTAATTEQITGADNIN